MSRAGVAVAALVLHACVPIAKAQAWRGADTRTAALLARAESAQARLALGDSLARRAVYQQRIARRYDAGGLTLLLAGSAGDATGRRLASGASSYLDSLGALAGPFVARRVVVALTAAAVDSVLRSEQLGGRVKVMADLGVGPDTLADGYQVAAALTRAFWDSLDPDWRSWASPDLGLGWLAARDGEAARRDLLSADTRAGERCLEGDIAGCRLWLGLDRDPDPYGARYESVELRRFIQRAPYGGPRALAGQCLGGVDRACADFARQSHWISPIPAGVPSRRSLIQAVRALHGSAALRRALADTAGSVGARFSGASGVSEDSLLAEWRTWLLTGGGHPRVTADVRDALPAAVFGALLLFAAARSGRWH